MEKFRWFNSTQYVYVTDIYNVPFKCTFSIKPLSTSSSFKLKTASNAKYCTNKKFKGIHRVNSTNKQKNEQKKNEQQKIKN